MKNAKTKSIDSIWNRNFICIILTSLILGISHYSVNPLVASYTIHLGASALVTGILAGLLFGVALSMRPVAGPVITKFDKRKLMILVFAIGGIANIGYALFHNITAFILFRFLHGIQYSLVGTLTMTLAGDNLPKEKMASGMGIYGLCGSIGMVLGANIGIRLLDFFKNYRNESFGFTCVFLFAVMSSFIGVIPSIILLPDKKTKQDVLSTGAWYKNIVSVYAIPMSILMFLLFVGWSLYNIYIVEYAKELEIAGIASFFTVLLTVLMFTRPISGWLTDRFGLARIPPLALILFAVSFLIVGFGKTLDTMLAGAAVASLGFGSFQPALFSMCALSETALKRSVASNTLYIGIDLGMFLGPIMGSMVYEMYNYSIMYKSASLMIFLALIVFILMLPAYHRRRTVLEAMETE